MASQFQLDENGDLQPKETYVAGGLFELDIDNADNLVPISTLGTDDYFELYGEDIMPIEAAIVALLTSVFCLNLKNNTWTMLDEHPVGYPIQLSYLGSDLHIEDTILKKVFNEVQTRPMTCSFRTKRFNFPSPALYKRFLEADVYCDGSPGINFDTTAGVTKSKVTLDGVDQEDAATIVYPGGHVSRQKVKNRAQKCFNFSLNLIAEILAGNAAKHAISSVTFRVNEKGGMR